MIPEIGLMIGLYIITRCVSFLTRSGERRESILVLILAGVTIIVTIFVVIDLFSTGAQISNINY